MFTLIRSIAIVAATLAIPAVSFAQSSAGLTRAQVRAELIRVENAGYVPSADDSHYPQNIQAAEAKIAAEQNGAQTDASANATQPNALATKTVSETQTPMPGSVSRSTSRAMSMASENHTPANASMPMGCVGPNEFCNLYFGS